MTRITAWSLAHKRLVIIVWLLATLVGMASSKAASNALDAQYSIPGHQSYETNQFISEHYGNGGNTAPLVAVVKLPPGSTVTSSPVAKQLAQATATLQRAIPNARIASYSTTHSSAFVSGDGDTTFILAYPPPTPGSWGQSPRAVKQATTALADLRVAGATIRVSGLDALQASSGQENGIGLLAEGLIGGLGALIVLGFVFASFLAVVPLLMATAAIMTSFLLLWAATVLTPISSIVEFLIALVGLGIAIDYALLITVRWREELAAGYVGDEAIVRAMERAGRAVVLSGTAVAVGLLALIVLPVPFLRSVGYGGMLIPLVSVAVAITLLPALLATVGRRLDWPHLRSERLPSRRWSGWARTITRWPWAAAAVACLILAGLILAATSLNFGPAQGAPDSISQRGAARAALNQLESSHIGRGVLTPVELVVPRAQAPRIASALAAVEGVHGAIAPTSWARGTVSVVDVFPRDDGTTTLDRIRNRSAQLGAFVRVGGIEAQNDDFTSSVYGSFPLMIVLLAAITFVVLTRAFRSPLLAAKAVILNLVSVAAAWGVLTLIWQKGYGSEALWGIPATGSVPSWLPLVISAFLFGLSMDYEVFILTRIREEYDESGSTKTAVVRGIGRTGRLVTSAALILFLAFVSMATAPNTGVKMMATGLGAGILVDATVVRALLVPAAVVLFGRWNWWLPTPLARVLRTESEMAQ